MIVVRVEMWPGGDAKRARNLGIAVITNDGSGDGSTGNYDVTLCKRGNAPDGKPNRTVWKTGRVEGFPRERLLSWDLLFRSLRGIVGKRNP